MAWYKHAFWLPQWNYLVIHGAITSANFNAKFEATSYANHVRVYQNKNDFKWYPPLQTSHIFYKDFSSSTAGWSIACPNYPNGYIDLTLIYTESSDVLADQDVYLHDIYAVLISDI